MAHVLVLVLVLGGGLILVAGAAWWACTGR